MIASVFAAILALVHLVNLLGVETGPGRGLLGLQIALPGCVNA